MKIAPNSLVVPHVVGEQRLLHDPNGVLVEVYEAQHEFAVKHKSEFVN